MASWDVFVKFYVVRCVLVERNCSETAVGLEEGVGVSTGRRCPLK